MSISLGLLELSSQQANEMIVREQVIPTVNPEYLDVGFPVIREDGDVDLPVFGTTEAYQDPSWPYRGGAHVRYKRLDLNDVFGPLRLQVRVDAIYNTESISTYLGSVFNFQFELTDFYQEVRELQGLYEYFTLRASPESPRWKGEVTILVHR